MKQSYIGSYRRADHREHHDRSYGRGAAQDFTMRLSEDGSILSITPDISDEVKGAILKTIGLIVREQVPIRAVIDDVSVQIYQVINF
jgi:hypothetical protein